MPLCFLSIRAWSGVMLFTASMLPCIVTALCWFCSCQQVRSTVLLEWAAPFLSGGGYCSEAFSYVHALYSTGFTHNNVMKIVQHGDSYNQKFVMNMRKNDSIFLKKLMDNQESKPYDYKISICHSEPGAWYTPYPKYHTQPCPSRNSNFKIGRTM